MFAQDIIGDEVAEGLRPEVSEFSSLYIYSHNFDFIRGQETIKATRMERKTKNNCGVSENTAEIPCAWMTEGMFL